MVSRRINAKESLNERRHHRRKCGFLMLVKAKGFFFGCFFQGILYVFAKFLLWRIYGGSRGFFFFFLFFFYSGDIFKFIRRIFSNFEDSDDHYQLLTYSVGILKILGILAISFT